ncbi:phasin family protein [Reyranella sp. MMS21-HV4-11]|uniref:Phasin family protein n=1 Tax=Reyranella humidisoli TaxID=2849149 RepID=A0ABS6IQG9_9HYPH|nr:phasin family protein [Reyranella sp. MMS21-HV4-11]MBU8876260.1 phasin family protein [Reyranella sp. MMS21-HV4-11]
MTTQTAAIENVIEHANETTKAAGERVREFAQIGVRKATEGFEKISQAAQTASEEMNTQYTQARQGATKASLKILDVAKEDADAGFAAMRDFLSAKSPLEAFDVSAKYWRGRLETRIAQAQDLGAFVRKSADDVVRPVQERIEKFTKTAA